MVRKQILSLFMVLAAFFAGLLTHSITGASAAAALAAAMFYCKFLPIDDSDPTPMQQNIGLVIAIPALAVYVLSVRFDWLEWYLDIFSAASSGYFVTILIVGLLSSLKKK